MSQIASFYLIKNNQRKELSDGNCSGAVYMAIWDWCEYELDLDVRFPASQTEDTLDCVLLEGELASKLLAALCASGGRKNSADHPSEYLGKADGLLYGSRSHQSPGGSVQSFRGGLYLFFDGYAGRGK